MAAGSRPRWVFLLKAQAEPNLGHDDAQHVRLQQLLANHDTIWILRYVFRSRSTHKRRFQLFDVGGELARKGAATRADAAFAGRRFTASGIQRIRSRRLRSEAARMDTDARPTDALRSSSSRRVRGQLRHLLWLFLGSSNSAMEIVCGRSKVERWETKSASLTRFILRNTRTATRSTVR